MAHNEPPKAMRQFIHKVVVVGVCASSFLLAFARVEAAEMQKLNRRLPEVAANLAPVGRVSAAHRLNLAIGLPLRNREALDNLIHQLYDPSSPNYRHYLTPEQFGDMFGATEADYQAVIDFMTAHGLTVTKIHPNRLVVDVQGTVADVERVMHVTMREYRHPREARNFYAPDVEPSLDLSVPILEISGLNNYSLRRPMLHRTPLVQSGSVAPKSGSGPSSTYIGKDFRNAYVPGATNLTGTGQIVGLLQFDAYYTNDIKNYISTAGISTSVVLTNVTVGSVVPTPGTGNGEVTLDIQMVISMAPGVSKIFVFEATNDDSVSWSTMLSTMASYTNIHQFSCSWGDNSAGTPDYTSEGIFLQMATQGQSFYNASGDSDAFSGGIPFPSESTNITQVGGTTLTMTGTGTAYSSETVWNWGGGQGSSGGVSANFRLPYYQQGISMTANKGSTTWRNVPDVALTADNVYNISDNGATTGGVGGTSCAAPLWAGFTALINQQAAANGQGPVGFLNPAIYTLGKGSSYTACFHDTTTGNNGTSSKYPAVTGFDLCTGWGTPTGTNLINALVGPPPAPGITGFSPASGFVNTTVTITGSNFLSASSVTFNGTSASFTVNSGSQITATVPLTATTGPITVVTPSGTATSASNFTVLAGPPAPAIASFSPAYGPTNSSVVVTGQYFTNVSAVSFNGTGAGFMVNSSTQITATVPAGATTGPISVVTSSGSAASASSFAVLSGDGSPSITSFTPASGTANSSVVITGVNFAGVTAVTFNGASASFSVDSLTQITATVPSAATTGPIAVTNPYGTGTSSSSFTMTALVPDLAITMTHAGNFPQGDTADTYTIIVTNMGAAASSGTVTVTDAPPSGLTITSMSGTGWSYNSSASTCTRSDALAVGAAYPAINVTVSVSASAPGSVTNMATVSGGGESNTANNSASDPTTINSAGGGGYAGVLAGWDVSGQTSYGTSPLSATTNASNLSVGGLTRGSGVTTINTAAARAWGGNGFASTSESAATNASQFASFRITANAGYKVSFTNLSRLDYRRSSKGPPNGALQYQVGSGGFVDIITNLAYASTTGASLGPINLAGIAALQNIGAGTNVTFRIVNWGATSSGGNWYIFDVANSTADDLEVQGTVVAACSSPTALTPTASPASTVCAGTAVTLTANATGGSAPYTYQWKTNGTAISGATGSTYSITSPKVADALNYTVDITSSCGGTPSTSPALALIVNAIPSTPTAGNNGPVCAGSTLTLTTPTVSGATYSWTGPNGFTSSAQNPTVSSSATVGMSGTYYVTVAVNGCPSAAGSTTVTVNPACVGGTTIPITAAVSSGTGTNITLTGQTGSIVKWQSSTDGNNWSDIPSTANSLSTGALTQTTEYRAVVQSGVCATAASSVATVNVNALVAPTLSGIEKLSATSIKLTFSGSQNQTYKVLEATDVHQLLSSWNVLTNGTFGGNPETFTDPDATGAARFYRITSP